MIKMMIIVIMIVTATTRTSIIVIPSEIQGPLTTLYLNTIINHTITASHYLKLAILLVDLNGLGSVQVFVDL